MSQGQPQSFQNWIIEFLFNLYKKDIDNFTVKEHQFNFNYLQKDQIEKSDSQIQQEQINEIQSQISQFLIPKSNQSRTTSYLNSQFENDECFQKLKYSSSDFEKDGRDSQKQTCQGSLRCNFQDCDKSYFRRIDLYRHQNTVHGRQKISRKKQKLDCDIHLDVIPN